MGNSYDGGFFSNAMFDYRKVWLSIFWCGNTRTLRQTAWILLPVSEQVATHVALWLFSGPAEAPVLWWDLGHGSIGKLGLPNLQSHVYQHGKPQTVNHPQFFQEGLILGLPDPIGHWLEFHMKIPDPINPLNYINAMNISKSRQNHIKSCEIQSRSNSNPMKSNHDPMKIQLKSQ